ncbi:unnamed protein product (macronuclear) [Paramecium tetraurelia]|uniref:CBM20 domain-containing protein n=1 Tax=Paramecium tetraurelia TaxID=5888 RepID=A0E215_PARTE|nr:uncharacterized protein GSPATT00022503001 [Paramecium tetraurelia]CAK89332.1 unnamed protein product [Paramecium tetraurelia]|eukprot:XP_001456729.1 hypothetical protein (macronuclear) [Paramecium tetraurelia strain d4-2]
MSSISIQRHVNYGEVILIVGDCHLVQWNVQNGIQMEWNPGDVWRARVECCCLPMNYRYVIVKQSNRQIVEWEDGISRVLNSQNDVEDAWNHIKIRMKVNSFHDSKIKGKNLKLDSTNSLLNENEFEYRMELEIPSKSIHSYAYKYQQNHIWERNAVRLFTQHPILNNVIEITDSDVDFALSYNQLLENIYVGSFLYTDELHVLQNLGVEAIVNLQTTEDLINKDLQEDYFDHIRKSCESYQITYLHCPIQDCNKRSFLKKGMQAHQILKKLMQEGKCVYVHCTDGIQRSIQTVILYLVLDLNYSLEDAIALVKAIRKRSKPIREVLQQLLEQ